MSPQSAGRHVQEVARAGWPRAAEREGLIASPSLHEIRSAWADVEACATHDQLAAVRQADALLAAAIRGLVEGAAAERERIARLQDLGEPVDPDELRASMERYRAFFRRLLAA